MTRDDVIERLRTSEPRLRRLGVARLYLYGSGARDELGSGSDIDLFFDPEPGGPLGFDTFMDAYLAIRSALGRDVDFTTRDGLFPYLRPTIERSAVRVF